MRTTERPEIEIQQAADQREKVRQATRRAMERLELKLEALEERIAPGVVFTGAS